MYLETFVGKIFLVFVATVALTASAYAQSTTKPKTLPMSPPIVGKPGELEVTISQNFANDARAALIAIVANPGSEDDHDVREAMAAVQVDATMDEPATLTVYANLLTLDLQSHNDRLPTACVMDYAKELRSLYYTGLPQSCSPKPR
ncbi:MAG: hypothetical protein ACLP1Y_04850 [Candidatus Acidiferrales bacterium]